MGLNSILVDGDISNDAADAAMELAEKELQIDTIINTLLADCPYELYWHDKVAGVNRQTNIGAEYTNREWRVFLTGDYLICLSVAGEFAVL